VPLINNSPLGVFYPLSLRSSTLYYISGTDNILNSTPGIAPPTCYPLGSLILVKKDPPVDSV